MKIISHRGFWIDQAERNTLCAFKRSFQNNFGVETDLRDIFEKIVISHDLPSDDNLHVDDFFSLYKQFKSAPMLALNIKSDGLQYLLKSFLEKYNINNYFVFDMSVPDALIYLNLGFNVFTRQSEYEQQPNFYKQACGVWMDEFESHWISENIIKEHLKNNKKVCIVSPELHEREFDKEWQDYKRIFNKLNNVDDLMICTDYPLKAKDFFNV